MNEQAPETREQFYRRYLAAALRPDDPDSAASVLDSIDAAAAALDSRLCGMGLDADRLESERQAVADAADALRDAVIAEGTQQAQARQALAPAPEPDADGSPPVASDAPLPPPSKRRLAFKTPSFGSRPVSRRTALEAGAAVLLGVPGLLWWWQRIPALPARTPAASGSIVVPFAPGAELLTGWSAPEPTLIWTNARTARLRLRKSAPGHTQVQMTFFFHGLAARNQDVSVTTTEPTPQILRLSNGGKPGDQQLTLKWPQGMDALTIDIAVDPLVRPSDYAPTQDHRNLGVALKQLVTA